MADRCLEAMRLFDGYQPERVGEGKVGLRIGVQDGYAEAVFHLRRQYHWKLVVEQATHAAARRWPPCAANAAIESRSGASASFSVTAGFPEASTTRTRWPCTAAIADSVRICRSRLPGLNGRSSRAGLARSTML